MQCAHKLLCYYSAHTSCCVTLLVVKTVNVLATSEPGGVEPLARQQSTFMMAGDNHSAAAVPRSAGLVQRQRKRRH